MLKFTWENGGINQSPGNAWNPIQQNSGDHALSHGQGETAEMADTVEMVETTKLMETAKMKQSGHLFIKV